jgi:DNA-directed RNA polymerase subunit H (RpoH/RPB5)
MSARRKGQNLFLTAGAPLVVFILGSSYGLSIFTQTQYEVRDKQTNSVSTRKFDLEEEHKKLMSKLDIDNFTLSRIPRPDEVRQQSSEKSTDGRKK